MAPTTADPLDIYGLPSKGETRLNTLQAQEAYYERIVDRYMQFCADQGDVAQLENQFALVAIASSDGAKASTSTSSTSNPAASHPNATVPTGQQEQPAGNTGVAAASQSHSSSNGKLRKTQAPAAQGNSRRAPASQRRHQPRAAQAELETILHAMRKLREAIVATARKDLFAQRAYVFLIRACILVRHLESYHPALLYLLRQIHPHAPLPVSELREFVGYHVLDVACRQSDLGAAHAIRARYGYRDRRVERLLAALAHDDWVVFWKVQRAVDGHQRALIEWAVQRMRQHTLKCLAKSYFTAEKEFVEASTAMDWRGLVDTCKVGWELNASASVVTIRRPKAR